MLLGMAAIVVVFLLGRRIACGPAGLVAALGVAVYPPFIHSTGALFSEPPAIFTLPAAVLAFLWAMDKTPPPLLSRRAKESDMDGPPPRRPGAAWVWVVPGFLFGLTALIRPEYLVVGVAFVLLAAFRLYKARGWRPGLVGAALMVAAFLVPIVPWTVRNVVVLDRAVPISTGGGKALYVGTYLPADGEYQRVKALLVERYLHRDLEPGSEALDEVDPTPLFDRVARRYPDLPRDEALGKIGKENLYDYLGEDPVGYAAMTVRKVWRMWSAGIGEAMSSTAGQVVQVLIVLLALAGLVVLAVRRRWWELVAMATPIAIVTVVGAASLAAPRRNEILMTLVFPLAGAAWREPGAPYPPATHGPPRAGIFPAELTALRAVGLIAAVALIAYALARRRSLRNVDVVILLLAGVGLALVAGTEITDQLLSTFSFEKGNGGRILGLAVFAIFILFLLILRALSQSARNARQLSAALEGLAWEEFRQAGLPERFAGKVAVVIPAYNEADNIGHVLDLMPTEVCGVPIQTLVIDDGSRDGTGDVAAEHGALVARHVTNRGGGAALRTGYRLMVESGAEIVVTLDADGQHLPSEMDRLVSRSSTARSTSPTAPACSATPTATTSPASSGSSSSTGSSR